LFALLGGFLEQLLGVRQFTLIGGGGAM